MSRFTKTRAVTNTTNVATNCTLAGRIVRNGLNILYDSK